MRTLNKAVHALLLGLPLVASAASLESTSGRTTTLQAVRGPVTVVVCRDRDAPEDPSLDAALARLQAQARIIPVAEVSGLRRWPFEGIVRSAVHRAAVKARTELFIDWTGDVPRELGLPERGLGVAVLDRAGAVRFRSAGLLSETELVQLRTVVEALAKEQP